MTLPHRIHGGRIDAERAQYVEPPSLNAYAHPLALGVGTVRSADVPTCETCRDRTPAVYQLCHRQVLAMQPFALPECNATPVKRMTVQAIVGRKGYGPLIWDYCQQHDTVTAAQIRAALGVDREAVQYHIKRLEAQGLIYQCGTTLRRNMTVAVYAARKDIPND